NDPGHNHFFTDSFLWEDNQHFPLPFYESHLGNYGSASRALVPRIRWEPGFRSGWDQYDPYYLEPDSFPYYNQNVPVAKVKYSQASQEDTYLTLDFGRTFARGISISIVYDRLNQIGEFGHQRQKNTALGVGLWHSAPSGKYDAFYNFIANAAVSEENGGISAPELIGDTLYPNISVPVFLTSGMTTHKHRMFLTKQILHLLADTSSLGIDIWMQARYSTSLYKYADDDPSNTNYYGNFLTDDRGIRQFTFLKENDFSAGVSLPWRSARSTIQSSLRYRSINVDQEPDENKITELFWESSGEFQWVEPLKLKGEMSIGLGEADGNFLFRAEGNLNTGLVGKFLGYYSILGRKPYLIEESLFVNQQPVYQTAFKNPVTNEIGLQWEWEKQDLIAGIKWFVFDNLILFDTGSLPRQIGNSLSLRQFHAEKTFDFDWIGVSGKFIWQPDSRRELALPDLIYKTSLYGRFRLFKQKLNVMPGMDVVYHSSFNGVSYFPVNGRFHLTNGPDIKEYFRVDAAIGIRINFLKAFVRIEDLVGLWEDRVLYQADFYPHYPGYIRFGFTAGFFN
ncbi:MAG: putative porin, partial [Saprospiraceae bacterium]